MSQASLSAARKRRAPSTVTTNTRVGSAPNPVPSAMSSPTPNPAMNQGLTLPQVITLVDKRLTTLEGHMRENIESRQVAAPLSNQTQPAIPSNITEVLDEFNERFETLADELANLKNIVLSLQSYTMDVNKTLLQERIRILGADEVTEESLSASH